MDNNKKSVFETLSKINVSGKTEKKNGLTYLSWAYAWAEVKKLYPLATYKVYERDTQWGPVNYFTDGRTCWVKVGVTIEGLEHVEMLPIMDYRNKAIPLDKVDSCSTNKAIQRAITKACGRHGMALYIYAGEDYPDSAPIQPVQPKPVEKATQAQVPAQAQKPVKDTRPVTEDEVKMIKQTLNESGIIDEAFICKSYKVAKLSGLKLYQLEHIKQNIGRLKNLYLADIVKSAKEAQSQANTEQTFADAIPPKQETEGEEITLDLSPAEMEALVECEKIFS